MKDLTSKERSILGKMAHDIRPVMQIGSKGLTKAIELKAEQSLQAHELIKIKFVDYKGEKNTIATTICEKCNAALVRIIGNNVIIYRPAEKEEDRKYNIAL
ncbi:MAG: hypothetical protein BKP49_06565 [Treponema sp. CETP13]|nr:MAG: hypothetical protein BKP49_06565 [Treponema sp. CETP13]